MGEKGLEGERLKKARRANGCYAGERGKEGKWERAT